MIFGVNARSYSGDSARSFNMMRPCARTGSSGSCTKLNALRYVSCEDEMGVGLDEVDGKLERDCRAERISNASRDSFFVSDEDDFSPDDTICSDATVAPFESGWRRDYTVTCTGDDARVRINFSLSPI